ncbi:type VI secretion system-associated protein TagF [Inquilinus sp.]|uniref:type VI secretion system-associated protein TagF n=1 Tax=Inquilinus sp. TaxID=1932117 RepID=UPI0031D8EA03
MPAGVLTEGPGRPGFFGKLPWLGDFVTRDLPVSFVTPWDGWLQAGMAATREGLGEAWVDRFLTAPIWRFLLPAGCAGPAMAGVLMPSVDRVGRYFPLTLAMPLDTDPAAEAPLAAAAWFDGLEAVALAALDEAVSPEAWEESVARLPPPAPADAGAVVPIDQGWQAHALTDGPSLGTAALRLAGHGATAGRSRFWTDPAQGGWYLAGDGLPPASIWPQAFMGPPSAAEDAAP